MKKMTYFILSIILIFSCGETYECPKEKLIIGFIGYKYSEIDSVILKRYILESNFTKLKDSMMFDSTNCNFHTYSDTIQLYPKEIKFTIDDEFDYEIINYFDKKKIQLSDFTYQIQRNSSNTGIFSMDPTSCLSNLMSYTRDSITIPFVHNGDLQKLYIKK